MHITKEYTKEQGFKEYYMLTCDFGSLQMRLTTQDTSINPGAEGKCDPGLYEVYNADSECPDAHSATANMIFCKSVGGEGYHFKFEDGSEELTYQDTVIEGRPANTLKVGNTMFGKTISAIEHRPLTTKEFKSFTKKGYIDKYNDHRFDKWRYVSKTINFGVLFNCSAPTLAQQLEDNGYTEEQAHEYFELTNNLGAYNSMLMAQRGKMAPKKVAFLCAASLMLEAYYASYPGVPVRTKRESNFAWEHGYSRNWHGPVRHLPELRYMRRNSNGEVIGADKKMFGSMISNRQNQAGNTPIQCMESRVAIATITACWEYIDEWNLKSYMWNMVHDSQDWCVYKPEADLVASLINACSIWPREPYRNVPMCMDFTWSDLTHGRENNLYHGGLENPWKILPIEEAVAQWNEQNKNVPGFKPIKWHGCVN